MVLKSNITLPVNYDEISFSNRKLVREEYIRRQEGLCYYCKEPLNKTPPTKIININITKKLFPKNFFKWPIHLHHDKKTGMTIGAVHCECNAVLWEYHNE